MQHTEAASQGPSPLPAKAPQSGAFLGSETSGPSVPPGLGSPHSVLALAVWKGKNVPRNGPRSNPGVPASSTAHKSGVPQGQYCIFLFATY